MITYNIRVMPNAGKGSVEPMEDVLKVYVQAPAVEGKANEAVVEVLAEHFKVRRSSIVIIKGSRSRDKVIGIGK